MTPRYPSRAPAILAAETRKRQMGWRSRLMMFLGGRCEGCGNNDSRVLQVDHRNGGGHTHRDSLPSRTASALARAVFAAPERFQLLCANCNWIKRFERGEYAGYMKAAAAMGAR